MGASNLDAAAAPGAFPTNIESLFNPKSIALVGASSDPRKLAGRPLHFLKTAGFRGPIYPINPGRAEIQGLRAYPGLVDVPCEVDQAIIALPAAKVSDAVEDCIRKSVRSIVLFSAGFAEKDAEGRAAQDRLAARCRAAAIRLLGPNCLGLVSVADGVFSTFSHSIEFAMPAPGSVAVVSQSGAIGTYALVRAVERGVGFSRFVATGNEADVDVAECISFLAQDASTTAIACYLESCRDGRKLVAALEAARSAGKPVILLKGGASATGSAAASSHTGALAGMDAVYDAVCAQTGARRVHSIDELIDLAYACTQPVRPSNRGLGVISVSGGVGVLLADAAAHRGLTFPALPAEASQAISEALAFASPINPVDVTPAIINDFAIFDRVLSVMLEQNSFASLILFFGTIGLDPHVNERLRDAVIAARRGHPDRLVVICMLTTPPIRQALESAGVLVFDDPTRLIAALGGLADIAEALRRPARVRSAAEHAAPLPPGPFDEAQAKALLGAAGIPFVPERIAGTAEDAATAAAEVGFPVALKVLSRDIAHKSDIGGVELDLPDTAAVAAAFHRIRSAVARARPDARLDGVLVAPMIHGGVEMVLGIHQDEAFGPVVMVGRGGVDVETAPDVVFRLAPIDADEAGEMLRALASFPILGGTRGRAGVDVPALAQVVARLARFAASHADMGLAVDVNPYIALPSGGVAVDALLSVAPAPIRPGSGPA